MNVPKISWLLLATISGLTALDPANANPPVNNPIVSQIPVQIKEIAPNSQPDLNPTPQLNSSLSNDLQLKIFDPLNPSQSNPQILSQPNPQIKIFDPLNPSQSNSPSNSSAPAAAVENRKPLTGRMIPAASAIVVAVPNDLQLDAGGATSITLVLARAIFDDNGEEIAPVNSLVSAQLQPDQGGVKIVADSLILRGKHIRIRASSAMFRGETIVSSSGLSKSDSFGNIGEILLKPFGDISLIGRGVGTIVGLFSPEHQTTVRIPQGTTFVLSLQSALTLQ
jgi:hypothetical protein